MKVEQGWKLKKLKELEPGDIFYFPTAIYMKTDGLSAEDCDVIVCVDLETGYIERFSKNVQVGIIEDATLTIGGYYK